VRRLTRWSRGWSQGWMTSRITAGQSDRCQGNGRGRHPPQERPRPSRGRAAHGPYSLQRHECGFCHTRLRPDFTLRTSEPGHELVAASTDMDVQGFHAVTCLSRRPKTGVKGVRCWGTTRS
jgi:hypothetical protein